MMVWRREYLRPLVGGADEVVFKRHECEWLLPQAVALKLAYNPRHLPVVINRETTNEPYYLYLSMRRIIYGYWVRRTELPINLFLEKEGL